MKFLKGIIASALILVTAFAFSACDFAGKEYKASDESYFNFVEVSGGYAVSAKTLNLPEELNIPETYNGLPVIAISEEGFKEVEIKKLAIPKSIRNIGKRAFYGSALSSIYFYTGVEVIEDAAFYGCVNLSVLNLPKSLNVLGDSAFASCIALKSVVLPDSVTHVGNACFAYCTALKRVYIPRSVSFIGESAFVECSENLEFEISPSNDYYKLDSNGYPVEK